MRGCQTQTEAGYKSNVSGDATARTHTEIHSSFFVVVVFFLESATASVLEPLG